MIPGTRTSSIRLNLKVSDVEWGSGAAKPGSKAAPPSGGHCAAHRWAAPRRFRRPLLAPPWLWRGLPGLVAARRRAEATTGFPTARARGALTAFGREHLHNEDRVAAFLCPIDHIQHFVMYFSICG